MFTDLSFLNNLDNRREKYGHSTATQCNRSSESEQSEESLCLWLVMMLWLPMTLLWGGICVRTLVTFTKLLYKQFSSVSELSGELSSEKS